MSEPIPPPDRIENYWPFRKKNTNKLTGNERVIFAVAAIFYLIVATLIAVGV